MSVGFVHVAMVLTVLVYPVAVLVSVPGTTPCARIPRTPLTNSCRVLLSPAGTGARHWLVPATGDHPVTALPPLRTDVPPATASYTTRCPLAPPSPCAASNTN